jgi:murein L,D-transpeptidase YcbB/YkuD
MSRTSLLSIPVVALLLAATPGPLPRSAFADEGAATLKSLLQGEGDLRLDGRSLDRASFARLYGNLGYLPIWTAEREASLVTALGDAEAHGLDAADFVLPPTTNSAARDILLTDAFLRYAQALGQGRVDSAKIESDWALPVPDFDGTAVLAAAMGGDPAALLAQLAPTHEPYRRLQGALKRYRAIAAAGGWPAVPESPQQPKLKRGDRGPTVAALRRRLAAEGFLADAKGDSFDAPLEAAVKRYQAQNGLAVDGHVGHDSFTALNVTAAARVAQIRDNLERWREMPRTYPATRIEVDIPAAWLTVYDDGMPGIGMRAIVGQDVHPTPVLTAEMNAVLFNPPWNIPISIMKKEILPHLQTDPGYMEKNHYVFVSQHGYQTIRQLPGPGNALGRIKFELPNVYDVYLHDTPSHSLFNKVLRSLSHGCVRLEDPRGLAVHVLTGGRKVWKLEDVDSAVATGETHRVSLPRNIPVYLIYITAFVDPDGAMEFRDDVYGRDARLDAAMTARDTAEELGGPGRAPAAATPAPPAPKPARATIPASAPGAAPAKKTAADHL